jgi:hypothetical protein
MRARRRPGKILAGLLFSAALLSAACESPIRVTTDRDPSADFSAWSSYAWISPEPLIPQVVGRTEGPPISPIDDRRIREAVEAELSSKGWKLAASPEEADLIASYGVASEERTEIYETPNTGVYYGQGYRYGGWYAGSTIRSQQVVEGTLTLQFFDRRSKQAAWVGWASKRLSKSGTPDREATIRTAIGKILKEFPSKVAATP